MALYLNENHPLYQEGFFYGLGAFETLKIKQKKILYWKAHLKRLASTCSFLTINCNLKAFSSHAILSHVQDDALYRLNLYAAPGLEAFRLTPYAPSPKSSSYTIGISLLHRSASSLYQHKTLNYLESLLLKRAAQNKKLDDVVILDQRGFICETTTANIFWQKNGIIYTPSRKLPILPGIIRAKWLTLLKKRGVDVKTGFYSLKSLSTADEIWVTNSMLGVKKAQWIEQEISI